MSSLFNLGGSDQQTDVFNEIDTETVTSTGGDIVTTDSSAQITSISAQDVTFISPDPAIGVLDNLVDAIAGFGQQTTQAGAVAQQQALSFASGFDPGIRRQASPKPFIDNKLLTTGGLIAGGLLVLFLGVKLIRG